MHSFASNTTPIDAPITEEERSFILNDSFIRIPTPKSTLESTNESMKKKQLSPTSLMVFQKIGGVESGKPLRILFDSGGMKTMIHRRALPKNAVIKKDATAKPCTTVAGTFNANESVKLRDGILPELNRNRKIYGVTATVFDSDTCSHDIIIGRDLLHDLGVVIDFANSHVKWMENVISFKHRLHWHNHTNWSLAFDRGILDILDDDEADDAFILDAKYEATTGKEVAEKQTHLTHEQRSLLAQALENTAELFDGQLGHYKYNQIHLELKPHAIPVASKLYSVPKQHESAFLKEL